MFQKPDQQVESTGQIEIDQPTGSTQDPDFKALHITT